MTNVINNEVKTKFTGDAGGFASAVSAAAGSIGNLLSSLNPLTALLGGLSFGYVTSQISALGSEFEQTQIKVAGMLTALGHAGDMASGLQLSSQILDRITIAAARLPGEAEAYIQVFQDSLPAVEASMRSLAPAADEVGKSLMDRMVTFSNDFTAVTSTFGIDAMQAGRDLSRLLQAGRGGAGMDNMTFMRMMPFLKQVEGQANLTAESFNKMTEPQRLALLRSGLEQLNPMIEAAGDTWDAQTGALASNARMLTRLASAPFFDMMKDSLGSINSALMDTEGHLTPLGQQIVDIGKAVSTYLVGAFTRVTDVVKGVFSQLTAISNFVQNSPAFASIMQIGETLGSTLDAAMSAGTQVIEGASGGAGGVMETLMGVINPLVAMFADLSTLLSPLIGYLGTMAGVAYDLAAGVLPALFSAMQMVMQPIIAFGGALVEIATRRFAELRPILQKFFEAIGRLVTALGTVLAPIIRVVSQVLTFLYDKLSGFIVPIFGALVEVLTFVIDKLGDFLSWLGEQISGGEVGRSARGRQGRDEPEETGLMFDATPPQANDPSTDPTARPTPAGRGGGNTVQDFRYSRFDIQQRFEEGFDPDRIAVAFATDLGRIGSQRLESGFQPLFALR
jgi:hypothetical protein